MGDADQRAGRSASVKPMARNSAGGGAVGAVDEGAALVTWIECHGGPLALTRTVFDHERDAPALDDAAALVDDLLLLDHEPAVTHRRSVADRDVLWMVSPTRTGSRISHSRLRKALTASGGRGTRQPSPVIRPAAGARARPADRRRRLR